MPDYQNMTATDAIRHAKDVSGLTAEDIAEAAGISPAVIRRYLLRGDDYEPGLSKIPILCRAMHNTVLLQWIDAKLEVEPEVPPATSRAEVLTSVARVAACVGDVQRCLADSETCGIDPACARELRGLLMDVIAECRISMGKLQAMAEARDMRDMMPLRCVRVELNETVRRPWWRRVWGGFKR